MGVFQFSLSNLRVSYLAQLTTTWLSFRSLPSLYFLEGLGKVTNMYRLRGNHAQQNSWNVHFVSDLTSSFCDVLRFPVSSVRLQRQRSAGGMATNQGMSLKFRWLHHHDCQREFHLMAPALLYLFTIFHTIRKSVSSVGKATKLQRTRGK